MFRIMAESSDNTNPKIESKLEDKPIEAAQQPSPQPEGPPTPSANDLPSPGQWFNSYFGAEWMAKAKEQVRLIVLVKSLIFCIFRH